MNQVVKRGQFAPVAVPKKAPQAPPDQSVGQWISQFIADHTFLCMTLLVALTLSGAYGVYAFGISSNLYVSEARFAIRAIEDAASSDLLTSSDADARPSTVDSMMRRETSVESGLARSAMSLAKQGAGGGQDAQQNPFVIANYLMSRAFVRELQQQGWFDRFARPSVDRLSRLPKDATLEEIWRFWNRHAMAAVDRRSNTIVVTVWAFTPEDAQATADLMIKRAEALVNEIETRGRQDALNRASAELARANADYAEKLKQISDMRQMLATVDPQTAAAAAQASLLRIEGERIMMQRELKVLQSAENANSPSANTLRQRSKSILAESGQIKDRITGYEADVHAAVNALAAYEELDLNRRFGQVRVQIASLAVENADLLLRQHSYFVYTFIAPSLPVLPSQGWRIRQWALVTFLIFLLLLGTVTFVTLSRDSRY